MKTLVLFLMVLSLLSGCGGITPSPQTAHTKIKRHFVKYGKKFKNSDFGKTPIDRVEIVEIRAIQKGLAEADAYAYLSDGTGHKVRVTFVKKPLGWKTIGWENLGPM